MRHQWWVRTLLTAVLLVMALLWVNAGRLSAGDFESQNNDVIARVYYNAISDIEKLAIYDVHEYNNLAEKYVLVGLSQAQVKQLQNEGWKVEVDVEATAAMRSVSMTETFSGGYRTIDEINARLNTVNAANPTLTEIIDYGDSYCKTQGGCTTPGGQSVPGYDLRAIRITNEAIGGSKPRYFLMANIHAREITTPELALRFVDWLIDGYNTNADARWLVDYHEVYIVPSVNPDGHRIVEFGPYYQRKNANRSNGCTTWPPTTSSQYGIDLNRNHTFMWNTGGSSNATCDQTYRGPSAGSEVETVALQNFVLTLFPDQRGPGINDPAPDNTTGIFMTLHSYGNLALWPWGNTTNPAPNATGLQAIGQKFATYNGYQACQPSVCLYLTSGTSDDWAYGILGIPSYTFEVGTAFMPSYSTIDSTQWPQNRPAFIYAAKIARTPYQTVRGPDALNVATSAAGGTNINITASANDSQNGNQTVNAAEFYIDTPPWAGGVATAMSASDGTFNSSVEGVTAVYNTSGLTSGQHIVFVRGRDSANNWGPFSAAFFTAGGPTPTPSPTPSPSPTPPPSGDVFFDNFETSLGWTVNPNGTDNATTGVWERGNPEDTNSSGIKQLGTTFSGSNDLSTGRLAGSAAGDFDIDGGTTSIRSPNITLPSGNLTLTFRYYLAHGTNSSTADFLRVYVVGSTTTQVFQELGGTENDNGVWATATVSLNAFAGQTVYIRIEAADASTASLVEAGIDDVRITSP